MPKVQFDRQTIDNYNARIGVYRSVPKDNPSFIGELKKNLIVIIENAFREYAKKHKGCTKELENKEWERFKKILERKL